MHEHVEMSAAALYSTIPLLPEFEQSLSSLPAEDVFGMEGLGRARLSSAVLDDATSLTTLQETAMDYETDCLQFAGATDLCKLPHLNFRSSPDPVLHDRHLGDIYRDADVMSYTELTSSCPDFSPSSTENSSLEPDPSDCSSSESSLGSPRDAVLWETIAECPVSIAMDPEGPLPPVSDILAHRQPKDDFLGLSNRRPKATLIKTEVADSADDSLDSDILQPLPSHTFTGNRHHHRRHTTTTTTTTIHHSNHHDYTTLPEVDENNNVMTGGSSRRIAQSRPAPVTGGEKGQKKKPGRKKGQVSKVLHLWEFIRDLLSDPEYCPRIIHWENEPEGIFRVLHSSEVARLWGEKKKNKKIMTYEKLSRSLRYSRKEGYFDSVPKNKGYPKKLCFKFGPKSHGWREGKN